jgi:glucokinase
MGLTIGVDIGGTKIAAGVVDEEGNILSTSKVPTPTTPRASWTPSPRCVEVRAGHEIVGVGIGAAGYVNRQRSTVYFAPNIDWRQEPLKDKVEARVGLPVVVENDANAAAWGEYKFGAGQGPPQRHLHHARHRPRRRHHHRQQAAPRPLRRGRRVRPHPDGPGRPAVRLRLSQGCWEQYASGRALVRYAKQRANATPDNAELLLSLGDGTPDGIEGKHISMAARQGDPVAVDSYRELARWAGAGLADLASLFDPSAFIVGGGLSDEGELVLDPIRKSYRRWLVGNQWRPHAQVLAAQLGGKAGLVGAADLTSCCPASRACTGGASPPPCCASAAATGIPKTRAPSGSVSSAAI